MIPKNLRGWGGAARVAAVMLALQAASFVLSGGPISAAEMGRGEPDLSAIAAVNPPAPRAAAMNPAKAPKIAPTYSVQVGLDGEIFPVFANHASLQPQDERTWGTVAVTVHNSSAAVISDRITVQVPGWSDKEIQMIEVPAGEKQTLLFAPTFLPRLFSNQEIAAASVLVKASDMAGRVAYEATLPVRLRAADDMYWGQGFKYAPFIASWVTPHDPMVEMVLSRAKEFVAGRRLPGYEDWKDQSGQEKETELEASAIYRAVQMSRLSYVKSSMTFGNNLNVTERIRLPHDSLRESSANCIDGVVLYASLFENLGMDPAVVLIPGHAYVGVRVARGSDHYVYFDTALTGRADFEAAVAAAQRGMAKFAGPDELTVRVDDARRAGILPMPESFGDANAMELGGITAASDDNQQSAVSEPGTKQ